MLFYSGFCLHNEHFLFKEYLKKSAYTVAGFSKGAIAAFEFALDSRQRIDTLQLISPAFFSDKEDSFKKEQLDYFRKNPKLYIRQFLKNSVYPTTVDLAPYYFTDKTESLKKLLYYHWKEEDLQRLLEKGILLEVYLGGRDKIINTDAAKNFFQPYASIYFIKEGGHILNGEN